MLMNLYFISYQLNCLSYKAQIIKEIHQSGNLDIRNNYTRQFAFNAALVTDTSTRQSEDKESELA